MFYKIIKTNPIPNFTYVEVHFWKTESDFNDGKPPFLLNDFKMQIRTEHQRIKTNLAGKLLHKSGVAVGSSIEFTEAQGLVLYKTNPDGTVQKNESGQWIQKDGKPVTPFEYKHGVVTEYFDPQWQRELFTVPLIDSIKENVDNFIKRAIANGYEGDRRGTTLNLQVGAGADDGRCVGSFSSSADDNFVGNFIGTLYESYYRFTGVSGLSGVTIDSATIQLHAGVNNSGSTWLTKVFADDSASPSVPTTCAELDGKTRTTAGTDWDPATWASDTWHTSPSIVSVIQELADSYNPSEIQILHDDDGTTSVNYISFDSYEHDTTEAPKLDIEHSAGGGGPAVIPSRLAALGVG